MTIDIPVFGSTDRLILAILREFFAGQGIHIGTQFTEGMSTPAIIAARERRSGNGEGRTPDDRFIEPAVISINTLTSGLEAMSDGADLQEMCRVALRQAQLKQKVYPGLGHISKIENSTAASRTSDWATSTGVVQYATLPKGVVRFESVFRLLIRPPATGSVNNRFRPLT
ncbi:hypothetical protein [Arthrobacter sp. ISL-95]|uniref:hypothetical protein n=1 Tax=Arthrobacter sp. ISL-95 TaxID=2819116 RepID=UPI001BE926E3|nr:hypothetical protein [Arthrobacter sp. ISL-95]MBT2587948.1 hypothetical protein [Arthrobacter sp. ISL-95]